MAMWIEQLRATGEAAGGADNALSPAAVVARNWANSADRGRTHRAGLFARPSWKDELLTNGSRRAGRLAALGALLALTGCGGGGNDGGGNEPPPPPPPPVTGSLAGSIVPMDSDGVVANAVI